VVIFILPTPLPPPPPSLHSTRAGGGFLSSFQPPPARVEHKGGGGGGECIEMTKKTTSSLRLDAREVVPVADGQNDKKKNHLQLTLNAREVVWWQAIEIVEETTSSSHLSAREVVVVVGCLKRTKNTTSSSQMSLPIFAMYCLGLPPYGSPLAFLHPQLPVD